MPQRMDRALAARAKSPTRRSLTFTPGRSRASSPRESTDSWKIACSTTRPTRTATRTASLPIRSATSTAIRMASSMAVKHRADPHRLVFLFSGRSRRAAAELAPRPARGRSATHRRRHCEMTAASARPIFRCRRGVRYACFEHPESMRPRAEGSDNAERTHRADHGLAPDRRGRQ
jgi:hypothetical protein